MQQIAQRFVPLLISFSSPSIGSPLANLVQLTTCPHCEKACASRDLPFPAQPPPRTAPILIPTAHTLLYPRTRSPPPNTPSSPSLFRSYRAVHSFFPVVLSTKSTFTLSTLLATLPSSSPIHRLSSTKSIPVQHKDLREPPTDYHDDKQRQTTQVTSHSTTGAYMIPATI